MLITLTTDFGNKDGFPAQMKGVILGMNPEARIVDITHQIAPWNIAGGSYILKTCCRYFPHGTIHVAVVDPGVGSSRRRLVLRSSGWIFIGPDNGLFSPFLKGADEIREITNPSLILPSLLESNHHSTFEGRDVFAPAAGWLSADRKMPMAEFGPEVTDPVIIENIYGRMSEDGSFITGEVLHIDRFGNCITSISGEQLKNDNRLAASVEAAGRRIGLARFYAEVSDAAPHALLNSEGFLEIFFFKGNAAVTLGLKPGDPVRVVFA